MTKVILHTGDKVTHSTLGEGVVTIVDNEFVTIKFATDELTFLIPDAFKEGFLSFQDAEFVDIDDDEYEDWEEDEEDEEEEDDEDEDVEDEEEEAREVESPVPTQSTANNKLGCVGTLLTIVLPFLLFGSLAVLSFIAFKDTDFVLFFILGIFNVALLFIFISFLARDWKKPLNSNTTPSNNVYSTGLSPSAKFSAIMLGLWMGGRSYRKKHGSLFDSAHDDLFWQEKYRKDRYYDDEEDL